MVAASSSRFPGSTAGMPAGASNMADLSVVEILKKLSTDAVDGLSSSVAGERLAEVGPNELGLKKEPSPWELFFRQFQSSVVVMLLIAAGISFFTGEHLQCSAILAAVIINAVVGFATELKSQMSLKALENLTGPTARVVRDGRQVELPARELVPGDIVILDAGARVPADLRLVETASMSVDESAMTGESVPVYKESQLLPNEEEDSVLAFQGTLVLQGRGKGVVIATGDRTKLGLLGRLLSDTISARTPLEEKLEQLGSQLSIMTVVICAVLAVIGILHNEKWSDMLQTSIALAVAAIPEGLPVVATLALAAGTRRMVKARALIRQLAAVETLGCTTVICTDKTGTLTTNEMVVTDLILKGRHLKLTGTGYEPVGELSENGAPVCALDDRLIIDLLRVGALCNDAKLESHDGDKGWHIHGDPTEGALLVAAAKVGMDLEDLERKHERLSEIPFDLTRKRMSTIHKEEDQSLVAFVKGSPGTMLPVSTSVLTPGGTLSFTDEDQKWFRLQNEKLASEGLRVLAVATRSLALPSAGEDISPAEVEKELTFIGLIGMMDRPKEGVAEAIRDCHKAGIKVLMLTGDQSATAAALARELHILHEESPDSAVIKGEALKGLDRKDMHCSLKDVRVLARVTPEVKLSVVESLQAGGEVVAMTGDGVNDAPALRKANIGVAMGKAGTDLAREASNMVITDDNFSTIVRAVEQGRMIYLNIRRSIAYLLTASLASVMTIAGAIVCDTTLPLLPLQLLWLNLIMHIFPGLGIVLKKYDGGLMDQPPRDPAEGLLGRHEQLQILVRSAAVAGAVLLAITTHMQLTSDSSTLTSVGLATLSLALLSQAWSWAKFGGAAGTGKQKVSTDRAMLLNMSISYLLLVLAIYMPGLSTVLRTKPLGATDIVLVILSALIAQVTAALIVRFLPAKQTVGN